jgi:hypothetical protein
MPRPATRSRQRNQATSPKGKQRQLPSSSPRAALERRVANKPIAPPLVDSDDSDKLVVKGIGGKRRRGYEPRTEIYASGALQGDDKRDAHPNQAQRRSQMVAARKQSRPDSSEDTVHLVRSPRPAHTQSKSSPRTVPTAPSSVIRLASAQPTPSRDNSILDGIRPRKRQDSILRPFQQEDSSLDVTNDSFVLPDDESTPLHLAKSRIVQNTPSNSEHSNSASRKRKFGSSEPARTSLTGSVAAEQRTFAVPLDPSLPPTSTSALRESGRKQRQLIDADETDIMAPPISSSSSASPARPKSPSAVKASKQQPATLLTDQLQYLMPAKRRKTARNQTTVFDIPADSDTVETNSDPEEDSIFRPSRRKPPRSKSNAKTTSKSLTKKSRQKPTKPAQKKTAKAKSTVLAPSRSSGNPSAKTSLQPSPTKDRNTRTRARTRVQSTESEAASSGKGKRSGGSLEDTPEKENSLPDLPEGDTIEVQVGRSGPEDLSVVQVEDSQEPVKTKSIWDEIDEWSMDFENVSVYDKSSEKDAR